MRRLKIHRAVWRCLRGADDYGIESRSHLNPAFFGMTVNVSRPTSLLSSSAGSPQSGDGVATDGHVTGQEGHFLHPGLRDQEPVKGVLVQ